MRPATEQLDNPTGDLTEFGSEVAALLDAARELASTLELPGFLELLLDQLHALVGYAGTAMLILEGEELIFAGMRGPDSFTADEARTIRYPVEGSARVWSRLRTGQPIIIPDVYADAAEAHVVPRGPTGASQSAFSIPRAAWRAIASASARLGV